MGRWFYLYGTDACHTGGTLGCRLRAGPSRGYCHGEEYAGMSTFKPAFAPDPVPVALS